MTSSTQILRICTNRVISGTLSRNLSVAANPLLFRNDTLRCGQYSHGMSVQRTGNWFKRKYNELKTEYDSYRNRLQEGQVQAAGAILSSYCIQSVDTKEFFEYFDLPDTFRSWFLVSELHVYMICNRLMVGQLHDASRVKHCLMKALWEDVMERVKLLADIPTKKRKEYIMDLNFEFQAALMMYDCAFLNDDDKEIVAALWRRIFLEEPLDGPRLELLLKYVRINMAMLDDISLEELLVGKHIKWVSLDTVNTS